MGEAKIKILIRAHFSRQETVTPCFVLKEVKKEQTVSVSSVQGFEVGFGSTACPGGSLKLHAAQYGQTI